LDEGPARSEPLLTRATKPSEILYLRRLDE
jgi:hypothetical protein